MTTLTLPLIKEGETPKKLALNLVKDEKFKVRLSWSGKVDLDLHALVAANAGAGAKVSSFDDVLSTYNIKRQIQGQWYGTLNKAADGTFSVYGGALVHSKDAQDGDGIAGAEPDEWIVIDPAKLPLPAAGVLEIPLVAMIHPQSTGNQFAQVPDACVIIENSMGQTLLTAKLSAQFGEFVGVQLGSIMLAADKGAEFVAVGVGFNGDFNTVLGHFS